MRVLTGRPQEQPAGTRSASCRDAL
jgi:hypothetical protein